MTVEHFYTLFQLAYIDYKRGNIREFPLEICIHHESYCGGAHDRNRMVTLLHVLLRQALSFPYTFSLDIIFTALYCIFLLV
jgi:hypothetical protein